MTVTVYRSSDGSAPVLSGTAGTLITVLQKCLIDGYGSQTGAGWTYLTGFTNPSGNVGVFQAGTGSNGYSFRVNDNAARVGTTDEAAGTPTALQARIRGYETMNLITDPTGTPNPFPTIAQNASGFFIRKSASVDANARNWIVVADARTCYMFIATTDVASSYIAWMMGEYYSFKTSDAGRSIVMGMSTESAATATLDPLNNIQLRMTSSFSNGLGRSLARSVNGSAGAISGTSVPLIGDGGFNTANAVDLVLGVGSTNYTNAADSRLYLAPVRVGQATGSTAGDYRGRLRGLWHFGHPIASAADGDTFSGAGDLAGKTFLVIKTGLNGGLYVVETSNTWDSN